MMVCSLSSTSSLLHDSLALFWHISSPLTATPPALAACDIINNLLQQFSSTMVSNLAAPFRCCSGGRS